MAVLRFLQKLWFLRKRFTLWGFGLRHVPVCLQGYPAQLLFFKNMQVLCAGSKIVFWKLWPKFMFFSKNTLRHNGALIQHNSAQLSFFFNSSWRCQLHAHLIIITDNNGDTSVGYDEIKHYEENGYVGPVEEYWRIACKSFFLKSHSFSRLPVHL